MWWGCPNVRCLRSAVRLFEPITTFRRSCWTYDVGVEHCDYLLWKMLSDTTTKVLFSMRTDKEISQQIIGTARFAYSIYCMKFSHIKIVPPSEIFPPNDITKFSRHFGADVWMVEILIKDRKPLRVCVDDEVHSQQKVIQDNL